MTFSAEQIAQLIHGRIEGNPAVVVNSFGKIEEAQAGQIAFLSNPKYEEHLYTTQASVVIIQDQLPLKKPVTSTLIRTSDPYQAFASLLQHYQALLHPPKTGRETPVFLGENVSIGKDVYLGAFCYVGSHVQIGHHVQIYPHVYLGDNVVIGDHSIVYPGVTIYKDCVIGKHVILHAGSVIGSDGFGFAPTAEGHYQKIPQMGNVIIEDHVELGANTTIDRATMGSTRIKAGAKLDNLIQIAHNVEVGSHTVIAALTGISGSTRIGNQVMIGGQVGIVGHIEIADGTKITAQSGVSKTLKEPNQVVSGTPAFDAAAALRIQAMTRHLPQLEKRVKELELQLQALLQGAKSS